MTYQPHQNEDVALKTGSQRTLRTNKSAVRVTVQCYPAWWLRLYIYGVALTSALMRVEPDMEKVRRVLVRGTRTRVTAELVPLNEEAKND